VVYQDTSNNLQRYCILSGDWESGVGGGCAPVQWGAISTTSSNALAAVNVKTGGDYSAIITYNIPQSLSPYTDPTQAYVIFNYEDDRNYYYILFQSLEPSTSTGVFPAVRLGRVQNGGDTMLGLLEGGYLYYPYGCFKMSVTSERIAFSTPLATLAHWNTPEHHRLSSELWVGVLNNTGTATIGVAGLGHIDSQCPDSGWMCCGYEGPDEWEVTISGVVGGENPDINGTYICSREKYLNGQNYYNCKWNSLGVYGILDDFGTWPGPLPFAVKVTRDSGSLGVGFSTGAGYCAWSDFVPCAAFDDDLSIAIPDIYDNHRVPNGYDFDNAAIHLRAI